MNNINENMHNIHYNEQVCGRRPFCSRFTQTSALPKLSVVYITPKLLGGHTGASGTITIIIDPLNYVTRSLECLCYNNA